MVFGRQNGITSTSRLEKPRPFRRIKVSCVEAGRKIAIRRILVKLLMMRTKRLIRPAALSLIPFRITKPKLLCIRRREGRNCVRTPMHKNPELCILPPLRNRAAIERFPGCLILPGFRRQSFRCHHKKLYGKNQTHKRILHPHPTSSPFFSLSIPAPPAAPGTGFHSPEHLDSQSSARAAETPRRPFGRGTGRWS